MKASAAPRLYVAEPRPTWAQRPPVVVDCSVLAAVLFDEPAADEALRHLSGRALHAPGLIVYEMANVARSKQRSGMLAADARAAMDDLALQRIELHEPPAPPLFDLAAASGLSAYDAAYLWLAVELKAPLATFDRRLAEAARAHLGEVK